MATKVNQNSLYLMAKGGINFDTHSFIIILMQSGFVFDRANRHTYADVSADELTTGNGYTQKNKVLTGVSITRDDALYKAVVKWNNPSWVASGGPIGPACGAFILDDTHADDPLVLYIDFGGDGTEPDGGTFTITNPKLELTT